ncbi:MAG: N-acetylmuramoyl-L-alanine amidase [Hydrogenoanaerobacterium sp.]
MKKGFAKAAAFLTAMCILVSGSTVTALAAEYDDFDYITNHVSTDVSRSLEITRPGRNVGTNASNYYITGTSDPGQDLYLNGEKFNRRGISGSFGVYMSLANGANVFTFTQDDGSEKTITITRDNSYGIGSGSAASPENNGNQSGGVSSGPNPVAIQVKEVSACVFSKGNENSGFVATAKRGAMDYVVDSNAAMYKLSVGGWIKKDTVRPINLNCQNNVNQVTFSSDSGGERFSIHGTSQPIAKTYRSSEALIITLPNTSGIGDIPTNESKLFSSAEVTEENGATTIKFNRYPDAQLWGYVVEYNDNVTTVYCKYPPTLSGGSTPLAGITITLDAGHGGSDPGALGIMNGYGTAEKDITADTAIAVQKRLESLGATVYYTGSGTIQSGKTEFVTRMSPAYENKTDFFISLHCNSIGANQNGSKPAGIEIYYYDSIAKPFSQKLMSYVTGYTGRPSRGARQSYYRVTLNSCAPSVLVEMGFICNPLEFDDMSSKMGIFHMANAIGDGIVSYLS